MMPPTSIDGTDITGATIDGTDVTEITVDGQTVFTAGVLPQGTVFTPSHDGSNDLSDKRGLQIQVFKNYTAIGMGLSANGSGLTTAYVFDTTTGNIEHSQDISSVSRPGSFRIDFDFVSGRTYNILADAGGSLYFQSFTQSLSFPITDSSVDIDILNGVFNQTSTLDQALNFESVGAVGL
jgi:hypothetical protein